MKLKLIRNFSTEGAPLIVGNLDMLKYWTAGDDDGSGIVVEYWGEGVGRGSGSKKFKTKVEAEAFEKELRVKFQKRYPKAQKPPQHPDYPVWYVGKDRVFGIERKFTSMFDKTMKKMKGMVAKIEFDKKHHAEGLFFEVEDGGHGIVATDQNQNLFVLARITEADKDHSDKELLSEINKVSLRALKSKGQIHFEHEIAIFDSGLKAPKTSTLKITPGSYHYAVKDGSADDFHYNSLWVWLD